jgi:sugar-specific transcriptional regulator TrmB
MQNVEKLLQNLGLSKSEAIIYLAGMAYLRPVGVQELQKRTSIKRPTIYHNIHLLESRGLVSKASNLNRTLYTFALPLELERLVQAEVREAKQKLRTVSLVSKELEFIAGLAGSTSVRHYEGIEGIKAVVETALYCKKPEWRIIAPVQNFFSEFDEAYAKYYVVTRKRHNITSKTLWEQPKDDGRELSKEELTERNPRYLPESMRGKFKATTIVFDNKVAIITSMNEQSAVLIESTEAHDTFAAMFDALYEISQSISC